jgi:hypothetical protein
MNPFIEIYYQYWKWFMEMFFEVRALRNCHNINVVRIDRIERALRGQGIG